MSDCGTHLLAEDLDETWFEDWLAEGIAALEAYLAKHAAFESFLDTQEA